MNLKSTTMTMGWLFGSPDVQNSLPVFSGKSTSDYTRGTSAHAESWHKSFYAFFLLQVWSCQTLCWFVDSTFKLLILYLLVKKVFNIFQKKRNFLAGQFVLLQQSNWIDRIAGIALKSIEKILQERGKMLSKKFGFRGFQKRKLMISFKLFYFRVF